MEHVDWVIVGSAFAVVLSVLSVGDKLAQVIKLLERVTDEAIYANSEKRDRERNENYPDLP